MNYLGNKTKLNNFIYGVISDYINESDKFTNRLSFFDLFTGTSSVALYWKKMGFNVTANDIQYYSFCQANSKLNNNKIRVNLVKKIIEEINNVDSTKLNAGFITKNYSPFRKNQRMFFTIKNAKIIDYIINYYKKLRLDNVINDQENYYLISKLIDAASKVSNTAVVYEAYLKFFKPSSLKKIKLLCDIDNDKFKKVSKIYNENIEVLIEKISGDILYLDPPYNSRGYDTNYHLLETISLGDFPKIKNVSGRRDELNKKSNFSMKSFAFESMKNLLSKAKFKYIFISYNNEGIISRKQITSFFEENNWDYKIYEKTYKRFKSNNNTNSKLYVKEIVYAIKKY